MAFYDVFLDAIPAYTGLSPVSFFTILSLMVGVYYLVCNVFFVSPETVDPKRFVPMESISPPAAPVQLGDVCEEELRAYDGSDPKKPLLMAIKGQIYDVSRSRMFYGPGGPYALFAGRDASRALALMSFDTNDLTGNIEGLSPSELDTLQDWEYKFMEKYVKVGQIIKEKTESGEGENGEETAKEDESKVETEDIGENRKNEVTEKDGAESI